MNDASMADRGSTKDTSQQLVRQLLTCRDNNNECHTTCLVSLLLSRMSSMFGVLSLIVIPVLTDKRNIMKTSKAESWISTENFTTMVKKSFLYSKCCNVFLSDKEKDGIEVKLFLVIAEKLNFTWTIQKLDGNYRYGRRNGTEWSGGVIQLIREKRIDLAFGSIWLTQSHNEFVNMTTPWIQMFIHFLVPRPQPITNFWALTRPFSVNCWILVIIMLFVESIYMYTRARIDPKFPKRFRSIFYTITELIGRLVGTWMPQNTANARFELHLWQTTGFLLITAYCSSLAARLTSSEYEDRIDTVRQFLEANLSWGHIGPVPFWPEYFDMEDPYTSQLSTKYIPVYGQEAYAHALIKKGKFAIFGKVIDSIFFPEDEIFNEEIKITLWLKESGIAHFHLNDVIHRRASFNLREVVEEYDGLNGNFIALGLTPLGAGFTTLVVGLLASTMVFVYELKRAADSRPIREVFRDIQKKREIYKSSAYKKRYCNVAELMNHTHTHNSSSDDLFVIKSVSHTTRSTGTEFENNDKISHNNLHNKAQNYYKRNMISMVLASFAGLLAIIAVPETLKVLIYTNKSSIPCVTFSRYTQTLLHIYKLYTSDPNDPDSDMYKTINVIHRKHKMSSKRSEKAGVGGIYQRDMAITQFAFIGYVLIAPKSIGLCNKPQEEEEALNHFWRVIGHMLQIPDRLNLCRKTAAETRELCQKMALAILDGLWYTDITLDKHAFLKFTYRLHDNKPIGWYSWLNAKYRDLILQLCHTSKITHSLLQWYKSMNTIRWHHKIGSIKSKNAGLGEITQRDMVLTQYGFVGFIYNAPNSFGLSNTLEENEAFNHFWRVNAYMLGISD
ncbi:Glutamate receptor delta-1 subunit, partial [Temnothorax longispinosus]